MYSSILHIYTWHPFSRMFWHCIWHSIWHSVWQSIWHKFWLSVWHSGWHSIWHSLWHVFGRRTNEAEEEEAGEGRGEQGRRKKEEGVAPFLNTLKPQLTQLARKKLEKHHLSGASSKVEVTLSSGTLKAWCFSKRYRCPSGHAIEQASQGVPKCLHPLCLKLSSPFPVDLFHVYLVGGLNPSEKYEFVNWDDYSQDMGK